jgi:TRAP-type transport system periplasmic protein
MPKTRRCLWSVLALVMGLALLLTACPADDEPADEPDVDTDTDVEEEEPADEPDEDADDDADEPADEPDGDMGEPVTLTLGHGFPAEHHISVEVLERFAEEVADATDGTVEIDIVPGGALGPPDGTYENVVAGGQDLGWSLQGYTAGRFPITQIVEAPFIFESGVQATDALWDLYEEYPEFQEEYGDVKVLGIWTHDVGDIWLSDQQVEAMEDLQGQTLRAPGPMQFELLQRLGAAPEFMPAPELYDAIDRGVLDGLMIANSGLGSYNLYELLNYGVLCNCYVATQFFVMNQEAWDSLSPQQQEAIDEIAGREVSSWGAEDYDAHYDAALEEIEAAGIEQYEVTEDEEEFARWQEVGDEVLNDWIEEREAEGVPAQEMVDRLFEIVGR